MDEIFELKIKTQKLLTKQAKKRVRQRFNKKIFNIKRQQNRIELHKKINSKIENIVNTEKNFNQYEELQLKLKKSYDLNIHQINDAQNYLLKLDAVVELYTHRKKLDNVLGSDSSEHQFYNTIQELRVIWLNAMREYLIEHKQIQKSLEVKSSYEICVNSLFGQGILDRNFCRNFNLKDCIRNR